MLYGTHSDNILTECLKDKALKDPITCTFWSSQIWIYQLFTKENNPQSSPFSSSMTALCPVNVNVMLVAFFFCCSTSIKFGYTALKAACFYGIYVFSVSTFCPTEWDLQVHPPHQLTFVLLRFTFPFIGFSSDWVKDIFSSQQQVCDDSVPLTCDHSSHFFLSLLFSEYLLLYLPLSDSGVFHMCSICIFIWLQLTWKTNTIKVKCNYALN